MNFARVLYNNANVINEVLIPQTRISECWKDLQKAEAQLEAHSAALLENKKRSSEEKLAKRKALKHRIIDEADVICTTFSELSDPDLEEFFVR